MRHDVESIHNHAHVHNNINRLTVYIIIICLTKHKILINTIIRRVSQKCSHCACFCLFFPLYKRHSLVFTCARERACVCLWVFCLFVCSSLFCLLFSVEITKIKTNTNIEASCIILRTIERLSSVAQLRNTE